MADRSDQSILHLVTRLWWSLLGAGALVIVILYVAAHPVSFPHHLDVAAAAIVVSLIAARYVDVRSFRGTTSDGAPATQAHVRRYALAVIGGTSVALLAAHSFAL